MFQVCIWLLAPLFYPIHTAVAESNVQNNHEWTYVVKVKLREGNLRPEATNPMLKISSCVTFTSDSSNFLPQII